MTIIHNPSIHLSRCIYDFVTSETGENLGGTILQLIESIDPTIEKPALERLKEILILYLRSIKP